MSGTVKERQCQYMVAKYSKAIDDFKKAEKMPKEDKRFDIKDKDLIYTEIHNYMGLCYYQYSDFEESEKECKKALKSILYWLLTKFLVMHL